jgi:hypothetical protein
MSNYSSQTLPPTYRYPIVHQYTPQSYYYTFNEYSSSPVLSRVSYPSNHDEYSSSSYIYYDDEETYLTEYYHHHHRHHRQYSNHPKPNRARNTSR